MHEGGDIELRDARFCAKCSYDAKNRVCYRWDFPIGVEKKPKSKSPSELRVGSLASRVVEIFWHFPFINWSSISPLSWRFSNYHPHMRAVIWEGSWGGILKVFLAPFCAQGSNCAENWVCCSWGITIRMKKKPKSHFETEVSSLLNTKVSFLENCWFSPL